MKQSLMDLISKAKEITASGLPFMEGKEKTELIDGEVYTVKEYGYMTGEDDNHNQKEYVVITDGKTFAYGGSVVTEAFKKLDEALGESEIAEILESGVPMKVSKKKSKNGRKYTACEFFPK